MDVKNGRTLEPILVGPSQVQPFVAKRMSTLGWKPTLGCAEDS